MNVSFKIKTDVVQFVDDMLKNLKPDLPWTTTIKQDISGDYYVSLVTGGLSEDTVRKAVQNCLEQPTNTSLKKPQVG